MKNKRIQFLLEEGKKLVESFCDDFGTQSLFHGGGSMETPSNFDSAAQGEVRGLQNDDEDASGK